MPTFCGLQTRQFNDPEAQSYSKFEFVVFGTHNIYYTQKKNPIDQSVVRANTRTMTIWATDRHQAFLAA